MNLAVAKHRLNNFETELEILNEEQYSKTFNAEDNKEMNERRDFLETQIETLTQTVADLKWAEAIKK